MSIKLAKINNSFEVDSDGFQLPFELSPELVNVPAVHQVVKGLLASRRQGNASTKTKAFVSGGGKKPFKQKGTGRARQGSTRSPLMPGGGTAHGPQKRSYLQKINKSLMNVSLSSVIYDKILSKKLYITDNISSSGKTKDLNKSLSGHGLSSSLIVVSDNSSLIMRAARNLRSAKCISVSGISVYEIIKYENLLMDLDSFNAIFKERLGLWK